MGVPIKIEIVGVYAVGMLPIGDRVASAMGYSASESGDEDDVSFGAGFDINITPTTSFNVAYMLSQISIRKPSASA